GSRVFRRPLEEKAPRLCAARHRRQLDVGPREGGLLLFEQSQSVDCVLEVAALYAALNEIQHQMQARVNLRPRRELRWQWTEERRELVDPYELVPIRIRHAEALHQPPEPERLELVQDVPLAIARVDRELGCRPCFARPREQAPEQLGSCPDAEERSDSQ